MTSQQPRVRRKKIKQNNALAKRRGVYIKRRLTMKKLKFILKLLLLIIAVVVITYVIYTVGVIT